MDNHITRRETIKRLFQLSGSLALTNVLSWPVQKTLSAWAEPVNTNFCNTLAL